MNDIIETKRSPRALRWALIIAIVIVLNLFFNYAITLFYPAPQYEKFCPSSQVVTAPTTQTQCLAVGGQWTQTVSPQTPPIAPAGKNAPIISQTQGYCNTTYTCQNDFTAAQNAYSRTVFIVLIILGIVALVCGIITRANSAVATGLSLGGVLSLIIAAIRYWGEAANLLKVLILLIALLILLWLGLKKFKSEQ